MELFHRKDPWYVAGLAFECTGCGACCAGPGEGYVWVTDSEIAAIAARLGMSQADMRQEYVRKVGRRFSLVERPDNRDCVFLVPDGEGGRRCRIYDERPTQCRTWPFWPGNLRTSDDWAFAGLRCRGINRGDIHGVDDIENNREATDR